MLIFGEDLSPNYQLQIGNEKITASHGGIHMGVPLTSKRDFEEKEIQNRISRAECAFYAVQGLGNEFVPVTPVVASKVYWSVCMPRMTHGIEVATISDTSMSTEHMAKWPK